MIFFTLLSILFIFNSRKLLKRQFFTYAGYRSALKKQLDTDPHWEKQLDPDPQKWMRIHSPGKRDLCPCPGRGAAALVALQPFLPPPPGYARVSIRSIPFRYTLTHTVPMVSIVDPDPHGSEPFGRIRIRSNGPVPDPTIKSHKSYRYKKYNKLNRFFCNIGTR